MTSNKNRIEIDVLHLIWIPYGIDLFKQFINSYKLKNAGYPHNLILLFNGLKDKYEMDKYLLFINGLAIQYSILVYDGACQDITAYHWAAKQLTSKYLFILNSHSQLLYSNWLVFYVKNLQQNNVGLLGATGSYQSYLSSVFQKNKWYWETNKSLKQNIDKYKLFIKAAIVWRVYFKPFPNPHIRTNAFLIDRDLFLSLRFPNIKTKLHAYRFESGRNGFTAQLLERGYSILLLDKQGKTYPIKQWPSSATFWQSLQENLLIADNQTTIYEQSDSIGRSMLSFLAWGK